MALTPDGVTYLFASNVLGHAALLDGLTAAGKLTKTAVYLGVQDYANEAVHRFL